MPVINTKLIQTRVPPSGLAAIERAAAKEYLSVAAWLRRIALQSAGVDGRGRKIKEMKYLAGVEK